MLGGSHFSQASAGESDPSPQADQQQLPFAMHAAMEELPCISVGRKNADLMGADNRLLDVG
jgi:hypothetical protein